MARRTTKSGVDSSAASSNGKTVGGADTKIEAFAEDLGRLLGTARARAESWLGQRKLVMEQLEQIRGTADGLLRQLRTATHDAAVTLARDAEPSSASQPARSRRRKLSAEGRAKIVEAQRRRWARQRAQKG